MLSLTKKQILEEIKRAQHILLLTDERIDGDTIGSTLGMYHILIDLGKDVQVFSPKPLSETLEFLPGVEVIQRDPVVFEDEDIDLVLIFDCADGEYIKEHLPKLSRKPKVITFDHHATNPHYGQINLIEPDSASAADVVWRFVRDAELKINPEAAQCILTGITTDTNLFSSSNTTAACLEAAVELAKLGGKLQEIVRQTMMNKSVDALKLWGIAFERLHQNSEFDAITTAITRKDLKSLNVSEEDLQGLSNFLNAMVEGSDVVLVLTEREGNSVKGSLRSRTRNVAELAQKFGGGGHIKAAGFTIERAYLEEKGGEWRIVRVGE